MLFVNRGRCYALYNHMLPVAFELVISTFLLSIVVLGKER